MWFRAVLASVLAIAAIALALHFSALPFFWISVAWAGLFLWLTFATRHGNAKAVFFNLAVVCATLAVLEAYLDRKPQVSSRRSEGGYTERYFDKTRSPVLGYRPRKDIQVDSRKYRGDELIYDVVYTIDANGLRLAPPVAPSGGQRCIIFFGGSFTFGEGVNDNQTMPGRVGERLGGRDRIYNFGFHGYGPHQMLSALQSGLARSIADCDASHVFYQGLVTHARRSAGLGMWDLEGPRYVLMPDGVIRDGAMYENYRMPLGVVRALGKSRIFSRVINRFHGTVDNEDLQLLLDIIAQARNDISEIYPNAAFHVIQWPPIIHIEEPLYDPIIAGLKDRGIDVTSIEDVLPGVRDIESRKRWKIAGDGHPNVEAQDRISAFVVENLIRD